jgi:succinate dehydrogenase / fumarate reductase, flavoprotein subunit
MYERITDENPYKVPMRIYPAPHYTMGGLWVDYNLMTTSPASTRSASANFSDHGANRLGASALMQGLADGYFVLPYTIGDYLADYLNVDPVATDDPAFAEAEDEVSGRVEGTWPPTAPAPSTGSTRSWARSCSTLRHGPQRGRAGEGPGRDPRPPRGVPLRCAGPGARDTLNQSLERAGRVDDFFELAQVMCLDARAREESCGGHFREEHQTEEGEALRDDENFAHVAAWEWTGDPGSPELLKEPLEFENVKLTTRSYK